MAQFFLERLKAGSEVLVRFLMRPHDLDFLPEKTKKLLRDIIDEQEMRLIQFTFVSEDKNEIIPCEIPNLCEPVFNWLSRYIEENKHLINHRPLADTISSLQKIYKDHSKNPEGWTIPYDESPELTKLNIKHIIQIMDLADSMDKIGGYRHEDYIFFQAILIAGMINERMFTIEINSKTGKELGFLYIVKKARPKKHIPCKCNDCGILFLNDSHPAKYCRFCKERKKESVKNRFCKCGCDEKLPEKFPNKEYRYKSCITRDRRKKENERKKIIISPSPFEAQQQS